MKKVLSLIRGWFGSRSAVPLYHLEVTLYTRRGCHLCEDAWQLLGREQRRHGFALRAVDIDTSAELAARYGECVPVVEVGGKVRFRGGVNGVLLRRLCRAAAMRVRHA